MTMESRVLDPR